VTARRARAIDQRTACLRIRGRRGQFFSRRQPTRDRQAEARSRTQFSFEKIGQCDRRAIFHVRADELRAYGKALLIGGDLMRLGCLEMARRQVFVAIW
jgi:hypothetical protein